MANGIQILPTLDRFAGLRQGAQNLVGGLEQQFQQQKQLSDAQTVLQLIQQQQGGQSVLPSGTFQTAGGAAAAAQFLAGQPTPIEQQQATANLELTQAQTQKALSPPLQSPSQTRLIGVIGEKVAAGTATPGELSVFNRLTEKAGTEVTINNIDSLSPDIKTQIGALKEAQGIINDFIDDPGNAEVVKNSDVNVVTNSKGQLQLEVKPKGAPAATAIKELTDIEGLLNSVGTIEALFDPSFVGIVQGSPTLAAVAEATGVGTSTKEVQFRRVVADLSDRLLRARSGAQINEQEFKRLQKILPQAHLSEVAFKARLSDFKREITEVLATKQKAIRQVGQRPLQLEGEPRQPQAPAQPTGIKDIIRQNIQTMSTEDKIAELRKRGVPESQIQAAIKAGTAPPFRQPLPPAGGQNILDLFDITKPLGIDILR